MILTCGKYSKDAHFWNVMILSAAREIVILDAYKGLTCITAESGYQMPNSVSLLDRLRFFKSIQL
jgi:hypothetical protein